MSNFDINRSKNEFKFINYSKAIGIILVVIGHSNSPLSSYIYLFHMSLFFFISGFLYKDKYSENIKLQLINKLKTLYLPFVKYQIFFLFLHNLFLNLNIYSYELGAIKYYSFDYIKRIINILLFGGSEQLLGGFWFITTLFEVTILYTIISYFSLKLSKNYAQTIRHSLIVLLFVTGNILIQNGIKLPRFLDTTLIVLLIFHLGYVYRKWEGKIIINKYFCFFSLIAIIVLNNYGSINVGLNKFTNPFYFIVCSLLGIYIVIYASKFISRKNNFRILNYIGQISLTILALHFLSFKIVNLLIITIYDYSFSKISEFPVINQGSIYWVIYSIIGVLVPTIYIFIFNKIKFKITGIYNTRLGIQHSSHK
jgi:fucose 4-O-acetylase-like acetyltransferase